MGLFIWALFIFIILLFDFLIHLYFKFEEKLMISQVVIVNIKGEILIYRSFKDDVTRGEIANYCSQVVATK